jgi:hypothetical protein
MLLKTWKRRKGLIKDGLRGEGSGVTEGERVEAEGQF